MRLKSASRRGHACLLVFAFQLAVVRLASADCNCGPTYCTDTPEYAKALAKKKADVNASYERDGQPLSSRVIALYDKLDHCEAAVTTAPDGPQIMRVDKNGNLVSIDGWTRENESNDAAAVEAGNLGKCYVILASKAFACCGKPAPEKRLDWDPKLQFNKDDSIACQKAAS